MTGIDVIATPIQNTNVKAILLLTVPMKYCLNRLENGIHNNIGNIVAPINTNDIIFEFSLSILSSVL